MRIDIVTIFPALFDPFLQESLMGKAMERGLVEIHVWDLRQFTHDRHRTVDDRPFGGGPGMVMKVEPVVEAVEHIEHVSSRSHRILLTPEGRFFTQEKARSLSREEHLLLLCGRYEGFDERIKAILEPEEISIGPYVLNGGEVAAMAVVEAVVRLIPGVLGDPESAQQDSFGENGLLDHPHYTRPREYRGHRVPEVLLSGDHEAVRRWRLQRSRERTEEFRKKNEGLLP